MRTGINCKRNWFHFCCINVLCGKELASDDLENNDTYSRLISFGILCISTSLPLIYISATVVKITILPSPNYDLYILPMPWSSSKLQYCQWPTLGYVDFGLCRLSCGVYCFLSCWNEVLSPTLINHFYNLTVWLKIFILSPVPTRIRIYYFGIVCTFKQASDKNFIMNIVFTIRVFVVTMVKDHQYVRPKSFILWFDVTVDVVVDYLTSRSYFVRWISPPYCPWSQYNYRFCGNFDIVGGGGAGGVDDDYDHPHYHRNDYE